METIKLTQYSKAAGCGCKISPQVLAELLHTQLPSTHFPQLLVGNASNDDAAVYDLGNGTAVVSTTDFFMPIVDDAEQFGFIASANAISDVYAMGGKPLMAIAILGWPIEKLPVEVAQQVMDGARKCCAEAGIPLAGGHSIDSLEPFFGLAVTGSVALHQLKQNNTAQESDLLFLTKSIGVGVLSTAGKRGLLDPSHEGIAAGVMTQLNSIGVDLAAIAGVHAMTDVTGFGIAGHLLEMAKGSQLQAHVHYGKLPILEAAKGYAAQRIVPDGTFRNWNGYGKQVQFMQGVNVMEAFHLLPDPQTNGGLLVAVAPSAIGDVQQLLKEKGYDSFLEPIGWLQAQEGEHALVIHP